MQRRPSVRRRRRRRRPWRAQLRHRVDVALRYAVKRSSRLSIVIVGVRRQLQSP